MYGYIYETTNLINNKKYIGKKKSNMFLGNNYLGSGVILQEAVNKYGKENFSVKLLEECDSLSTLNEKEKFWIDYFNARNSENYYNIASGGDGGVLWEEGHHPSQDKHRFGEDNPFYGKHHSEESKQKLRNTWLNKKKNGFVSSNKGKKRIHKDNVCKYVFEEELSEYIEQGWTCYFLDTLNSVKEDKRHSEETRKKISDANKGKIISQCQINKYKETMNNKSDEELELIKQHRSESHKGKLRSEESKRKTSETLKQLYASGKMSQKGRVAWNKGKKLTAEELEIHGQISKGRIHITNGFENKMIYPENFSDYESEGWKRGRTIFKK